MEAEISAVYYETHLGIPGDLTFYSERLATNSDVLELGAGRGRLTLPLLNKGHTLCAVDRSREALKCLRKKAAQCGVSERLTLLRADLNTLPLVGQFSVVMIPYNTLLCFDHASKGKIVSDISRCLKLGGKLLLDVYDGEDFLNLVAPDDSEEAWIYEPEYLKSIPFHDVELDVYQSGQLYPKQNRIRMEYIHFLPEEDEPELALGYFIDHYPISLIDLKSLLIEAGLNVDEVIRQPLAEGTHFFVHATKST